MIWLDRLAFWRRVQPEKLPRIMRPKIKVEPIRCNKCRQPVTTFRRFADGRILCVPCSTKRTA